MIPIKCLRNNKPVSTFTFLGKSKLWTTNLSFPTISKMMSSFYVKSLGMVSFMWPHNRNFIRKQYNLTPILILDQRRLEIKWTKKLINWESLNRLRVKVIYIYQISKQKFKPSIVTKTYLAIHYLECYYFYMMKIPKSSC